MAFVTDIAGIPATMSGDSLLMGLLLVVGLVWIFQSDAMVVVLAAASAGVISAGIAYLIVDMLGAPAMVTAVVAVVAAGGGSGLFWHRIAR